MQKPAKNSSTSEPLVFFAHADRVEPGKGIKPIVKDGVIYSSGGTILGADCKAGITEILEAVLSSQRRPPLEIVITREEELGL